MTSSSGIFANKPRIVTDATDIHGFNPYPSVVSVSIRGLSLAARLIIQ
jgi:hypothetical protein